MVVLQQFMKLFLNLGEHIRNDSRLVSREPLQKSIGTQHALLTIALKTSMPPRSSANAIRHLNIMESAGETHFPQPYFCRAEGKTHQSLRGCNGKHRRKHELWIQLLRS